MTTIHVEIDESLLKKVQERATETGVSVQELIRQTLIKSCATDPERWYKDLVEATERLGGNSGAWKWNREELYDRKVLR